MARRSGIVLALCLFACSSCVQVQAQQCGGSAIITLTGMDQACAMASSAIAECGGKMQVAVMQTCDVSLTPDLGVANNGEFCNPMRAFQSMSTMNGRFMLGRSDLEFVLRAHKDLGVLLMNLKGRVVPPQGGREIPVDCNLMYNVTGGSTLGITATSNDALMATAVQGGGAATAGGGYSGAGGRSVTGGSQQLDRNGNPIDGSDGRRRRNAAGSVAASPAARYFAAAVGAAGLLLPALL